uniref:hypothetical protein n=1 Tax=Falsiroseomonas oryzae TaxID=2766473 RepID=UPI0022EA671A
GGQSGVTPPLEAAAARLPASVAGFTRGSAVWHERERPGLGVTVDYAGPARAAVATVSLYDRGAGPVAERDPRVAQEFTNAVSEVVALAGTRTSQTIAERERSQLPVPGGAPLDCARLEGTYGRQEVRTLVCLGAAAGRFVKVQVTSPLRQVRPVDPLPFVVEVTQRARGA